MRQCTGNWSCHFVGLRRLALLSNTGVPRQRRQELDSPEMGVRASDGWGGRVIGRDSGRVEVTSSPPTRRSSWCMSLHDRKETSPCSFAIITNFNVTAWALRRILNDETLQCASPMGHHQHVQVGEGGSQGVNHAHPRTTRSHPPSSSFEEKSTSRHCAKHSSRRADAEDDESAFTKIEKGTLSFSL